MAGWYYPQPQPQQPLPKVVPQASIVNNPPVRTIAAITAILAVWPSVYDHTPYFQHAGRMAAILSPLPPAVVNDPPFARKIPVYSKIAGSRFYGEGNQYGFTYSSGALNVPIVPPVISNPPGTSAAAINAVLGLWTPQTWGAQRASSNLVQGYPGDEPSGFMTAPDLADYPYPTWDAQSLTRLTALFAPPPAISNPVPVSLAGLYAIRQTWVDPTWNAQAAYNPVVTLTFTYGQQPPPASIYVGDSIRSSWPQDNWGSQSTVDSVAALALPTGQQPPGVPQAVQYAIRGAWAELVWPAQSVLDVSGIIPPPVQVPVPQPQHVVRSNWADLVWPAQSAQKITPPSVSAPNPSSIAGQVAIRATWSPDSWPTQSARPTAGSIAPNAPPPLSRQARAWPDVSWSAQKAFAGVFTPPVINNPPPFSYVNQLSAQGQWPGIWWAPQTAHVSLPLGALLTGRPHYLVIAPHQQRVITSVLQRFPMQTGPLPYAEFFMRVGEKNTFGIDWTQWLQNEWTRGAMVALGFTIRPKVPTGYQFVCSIAGESGSFEPLWPNVVGATVSDGSVVWTCEPIDNTSLAETVVSAPWIVPAGVAIGATSLVGQIAGVFLDVSGATAGQDYVVNCNMQASDGEVKVGQLKLKVR